MTELTELKEALDAEKERSERFRSAALSNACRVKMRSMADFGVPCALGCTDRGFGYCKGVRDDVDGEVNHE